MKIEQFSVENKGYLPQIRELYQNGLDGMIRFYSPDVHDRVIDMRDDDFFDGLIERDGLYLAVNDGRLEGVLECGDMQYRKTKMGLIAWVLASNKGNGVGTSLINHYIDDCKGEKDMVVLMVHRKNKAYQLYKKLGFVDCGEVNGLCKMTYWISERGRKRTIKTVLKREEKRLTKDFLIDWTGVIDSLE